MVITITEKLASITRREGHIGNLLLAYFEDRKKIDNRNTTRVAEITSQYAKKIREVAEDEENGR